MPQESAHAEVLLFLQPWDPPSWFTDALPAASPGIRVIHHRCGRHDREVPPDIPPETWETVTVLFTWNALPRKGLAPRLRYVQLLSAGCNHVIGHPLLDDAEVALCTANGVHPPQIAEWVIATYLSFQHHLYDHWDNQKQAKWVIPESDEDTEDAVGCRMGILGYGSVGRQCAVLGRALGMDVHAYTLHERPTPESRRDDSFTEKGLGDPAGEVPSRWFHGQEQLDDFLKGLDILVIVLPLTSKTHGMIGKRELEMLGGRRGGRKAFVSNVGRGPIVKTDDLIDALNDGVIGGAALDVTDPEPLPADHALWRARNVVITPHVSGNSTHYNERVLKILLENMGRRSRGQEMMNQVNRALGY